MDKWRKAISFTLCFMALTYIGGFMLLIGAHQGANMVGVSVVIAADESAGGEE